MLVLVIVVAVKLAKVHDGYFLKNEFKIVGILIVVVGFPIMAFNLAMPMTMDRLAPALSIWLLFFAFSIFQGIDISLLYRHNLFNTVLYVIQELGRGNNGVNND
jgi:hypothetical protein